MIQRMTTDGTNNYQILDFPIQKKDWEELSGKELVLQARLEGVRILNQVAAGVYELTKEDKTALRHINKGCLDYDIPLLKGDF